MQKRSASASKPKESGLNPYGYDTGTGHPLKKGQKSLSSKHTYDAKTGRMTGRDVAQVYTALDRPKSAKSTTAKKK